jgi:hypothetical protein
MLVHRSTRTERYEKEKHVLHYFKEKSLGQYRNEKINIHLRQFSTSDDIEQEG